ncbi:MAG: T9SS type A sorting domain-containing protein [Caldithrix sp.]|nr:MAG: T9SS type A sorting domain-containing protein [Caldithrix sp.]
MPLAAGGSFSTTLTLEIPGGVPPATYGFNWKVGIFANGSVDVDGFNFTKNAGPVSVARTASFNTEGWESILGTQNLVPEKFVLEQNYPNPFNPATTISYRLPIAENVSLMIYDLAGRQVRELVNEKKEAGSYTVQWDGKNQSGQTVATGLYIYQIRAGQFNQNRKMLFMK